MCFIRETINSIRSLWKSHNAHEREWYIMDNHRYLITYEPCRTETCNKQPGDKQSIHYSNNEQICFLIDAYTGGKLPDLFLYPNLFGKFWL